MSVTAVYVGDLRINLQDTLLMELTFKWEHKPV